MKYLLDTHIVLWLAENSPKLTDAAKNIILNETNEKCVSVASCLEVAIKCSLGKLSLTGGVKEFFRIISSNGFTLIHVAEEHLVVLEALPFHSRDPFDRLLVSTAIADDLIFLSDDEQLSAYAEEGLQIAL